MSNLIGGGSAATLAILKKIEKLESENKNLLKLIDQLKKDTSVLEMSFSRIDLNNVNKTCFGYTNSCTNGPVSTNGFLETYASKEGSLILQRFTTYGSLNTYERRLGEGAWTNWIEK